MICHLTSLVYTTSSSHARNSQVKLNCRLAPSPSQVKLMRTGLLVQISALVHYILAVSSCPLHTYPITARSAMNDRR